MKTISVYVLAVLASLCGGQAAAHKRWLLPSDFSLSDAETVVVDFSASNNLFYPDKAMPLDGLRTIAPDGEVIMPANLHRGARRSSFELAVDKAGSYRLYVDPKPLYFASYHLPGRAEPVRARGELAQLIAKVPPQATELELASSMALIETYVTLGASSDLAPAPTAQGLTMEPLTHPNEIYSDEPAKFRFLLDGQPISELEVKVIAEGTRYRDDLELLSYRTDATGQVSIAWPGPGRYLLEATSQRPDPDARVSVQYLSYFLTLEVLAP